MSNCVETKSVIEQIEFAFEKFLEKKTHIFMNHAATAWLAQLGERRSAEREVAGSDPCRTNTQGL